MTEDVVSVGVTKWRRRAEARENRHKNIEEVKAY
jgi:hypothetical protein